MAEYRKRIDIEDEAWERKVARVTALWQELHFASDAERERLFAPILTEWSAEIQRKRRDLN